MGKAKLKMWVFKADLKDERVDASLMLEGREFQRVGAAKENARSPQVRRFVAGLSRRLALPDLRGLEGTWRWRRLVM